MRHSLALLCTVTCFACAIIAASPSAMAQRRITGTNASLKELQGINKNKSKQDSLNLSSLPSYQDSEGRTIYVDTITGREIPDTISTDNIPIPKMKQPLLYAACVGIDIWDPVMRLFGQHYGLTEFSAELNLHNAYIPVVEVGLGNASYTPEGNNYTYKVGITPYFRIGCNYNFLYNSNPDYMVYAGVRFGWSRFSYEINDVTLQNSYWETSTTFSLPRQTASLTYMQFMFGLRVKVWGPVHMGWALRYKVKLKEPATEYGNPWYIPGYGTRNGAITGSFSIFYTIPLSKNKTADPSIE